MKSSVFQDRRATGLLNRVRNDVSHLREDIGSLISHATRETLPNGARELAGHARAGAREMADQARSRLVEGGAYAASRLRTLRSQPPRQQAGWIGGAILVGIIAYGAYAIYRSASEQYNDEHEG